MLSCATLSLFPEQDLENRQTTEQSLINELEDSTSKTLDSTAAPGQIKLKEQLDTSKDRWEALHKQTAALESKLLNSLQHWEDHDGQITEFADWLTKTEHSAEGLMELKPDTESKQQLCEECQV